MHEAEWQMGKKRIDTRLDQLTPSLPPPRCFGATGLARAFAGKLAPYLPTGRQDPDDEVEFELLKRIETKGTSHATQPINHQNHSDPQARAF